MRTSGEPSLLDLFTSASSPAIWEIIFYSCAKIKQKILQVLNANAVSWT